jgi:hypothetical protein
VRRDDAEFDVYLGDLDHRPTQDAFWGGRTGYFADPDGHLWEVAWNPHFAIAEDGARIYPDRASPSSGLRLHFEAGTKIHPGRLGNWIAFSTVSPSARRHDAISSIDHNPDALVSAK